MTVVASARTLGDVLRGKARTRDDKIAFETVDVHLRGQTLEGEHLLSSCGRPLSGHEVRLLDDAGGVVSEAGNVGEIEIHSLDLMHGYATRKNARLAHSLTGRCSWTRQVAPQ